MNVRKSTAIALLLHGLAAGADVTVYRSVDASGKVSYSDRPPPDAPSEEIRVDATAPPPSPEMAERRAAISRMADELRDARHARESAGNAPGVPLAPAAATPASPASHEHEDWLPLYYPYPTYRPPQRPPWNRPPAPPLQPAPVPRPNPDSLSPRGLEERLRRAR